MPPLRHTVQLWIRERPLTFVLLVAAAPRLVAVIWSHGFIHSDDHYDTVMIAFDWLNNGLWGSDGFLRWRSEPSTAIGRFPLYTLSLYAVMKVHRWLGVISLETMMYTVRALHALVSLIPVVAAFKITEIVTGRRNWALGAGLFLALSFALPFLGVRNLIEMVGGAIWMAALLALYLAQGDSGPRWLIIAGLITGLAWMVRFPIAFAAAPVPLALWYQRRSIAPALWYSLGVAVMLIASGVVDWILLGRFAGSTLTNFAINAGLPALYKMFPLTYVITLLAFMGLPLSIYLGWLTLKPKFWREHLTLAASSYAFLLCHSALANQQERFIFPIATAFMLMGVLALWTRWRDNQSALDGSPVRRGLVGATVALNVVGLAALTPAYPKKGLIEPILEIAERQPDARTLFVQPELRYWMPISYGWPGIQRFYVRDWSQMAQLRNSAGDFDYVTLYPPTADALTAYRDSAESVVGPLTHAFTVEPSVYDRLLHALNPSHNPHFKAEVYLTAPAGR
ncbi:MAG TPA: glycosyltransferase family 39 protein [candidate division Zixibacteria bacterium]|nr:glycosyltransferase family 39 protein [candidate division Zixibacteria bacterium]